MTAKELVVFIVYGIRTGSQNAISYARELDEVFNVSGAEYGKHSTAYHVIEWYKNQDDKEEVVELEIPKRSAKLINQALKNSYRSCGLNQLDANLKDLVENLHKDIKAQIKAQDKIIRQPETIFSNC